MKIIETEIDKNENEDESEEKLKKRVEIYRRISNAHSRLLNKNEYIIKMKNKCYLYDNKKSKKIQNKTLRKTNKNPNKKPNKTTKGGRKLRRSEQQLFDDVVDTIEEILAGLDRNISYCNEKLNKINNSISQIENKIYELEKETKKVKGEQYVLLDLINNNDMGIDERKDIWDEIGVYNEILDLLYEDTTMALKNYSVFLEIEKKIRNYRNSFIRTKINY